MGVVHLFSRRSIRRHEKWAWYRFAGKIRQFVNMQSWVYRYNTIVDPTLNSTTLSLSLSRSLGGREGTRRLVIRMHSPRELIHSLLPFTRSLVYASVTSTMTPWNRGDRDYGQKRGGGGGGGEKKKKKERKTTVCPGESRGRVGRYRI